MASRWTPPRIESRTQMTTSSHSEARNGPACDAGDASRLGRYRLEERIGAGGFGVVWRARDSKLERDVAVKVIPREADDADRPRVEREALAAARLNHPGIVALYEMGGDEHDVYLVSELVHGATLEELSREGATSDRDVARIGGALCDALEHAHERGVIHRDVKPANVMVLAEPAAGAGFAKLTDFGIAHLASGDNLTATGDIVGTLAYMAPEQAEGRRVTGATDVYSLALTLYEAWTGENPVRGREPRGHRPAGGALAAAARTTAAATCPPELCEAIDAALDPDPAYRPRPGELREVLRDVEGDLSDEGGLVEPETLERFGLTAVRARTKLRTMLHRAPDLRPGRGAGRAGADGAARARRPRRRPAAVRGPRGPRARAARSRSALVSLAATVLGGRASRAWAGCCRRCSCAAGSALPRPTARAPPWCWPPRWRRRRCCCRARACCGRCPRWRRCWAPSRWRRCSWAWPRWPPRPGAAPAWRRPGSCGWPWRR